VVAVRVGELLELTGLGLRLLAGDELDRAVRRVYTTDLPDPGRYLSGGELVLTGLIWYHEPDDADRFAGAVARGGAAALAAGEALGPVPQALTGACARLGLPLLAVPAETSFGTVTDEVIRRLSGDQAGVASRALGRHRRMMSAVAEGGGLDALFALAGADLPARCWLLTGTGRLVASVADPPPRPLALRLAREYLTVTPLPATVRVRGQDYALVPAGGRPGFTGWFLACEDGRDDALEPVTELAGDIALERARLDAARGGERRLGRQIVAVLGADGDPAQVAALLRAGDFPSGGRYLALSLGLALAALGETGSGAHLAGGLAALAEELVLPGSGHAAIGEEAGEALAVLPVSGDGEAGLAERIRAAGPVLAAGLRGGRLSVGISDVVTGPDGLPAALREARGARKLAELRPDPVSVVTGPEAGTHAMLLASVPADVLRSFRDRLLGPLIRYDQRRGTELVATLAGFLACSGSWNACAERLHVHVNTLHYRIRRIEELTGRDLSTLGGQVDFYLALSAAGQRDLGPD
jgi:Purine catabolism regulatory protein-like family/PucR C-terminal helix-turn-helix domain/GGDEF-like domain